MEIFKVPLGKIQNIIENALSKMKTWRKRKVKVFRLLCDFVLVDFTIFVRLDTIVPKRIVFM